MENLDSELLYEANKLFDSSLDDVLLNWDHYYQVYLDEIGEKSNGSFDKR